MWNIHKYCLLKLTFRCCLLYDRILSFSPIISLIFCFRSFLIIYEPEVVKHVLWGRNKLNCGRFNWGYFTNFWQNLVFWANFWPFLAVFTWGPNKLNLYSLYTIEYWLFHFAVPPTQGRSLATVTYLTLVKECPKTFSSYFCFVEDYEHDRKKMAMLFKILLLAQSAGSDQFVKNWGLHD